MKPANEYSITKTFSIQIKVWKAFEDWLYKNRLPKSGTLAALINALVAGKIAIDDLDLNDE